MIEELRIQQLGVIVDTTLPLGPGFTAITGETGAGKTMVVSALGLLMGERAEAGSVRTGAKQARVQGILHTSDATVTEIVDELGGEIEDGELILSRTVNAEGRSRANVGGAAAPVGGLGRLAERLFAVHGQSEQLRLKSLAAQRDTLDRFGGARLEAVATEFRDVYAARGRIAAQVSEIRSSLSERAAEAARTRAELDEIAAVDPIAGEEQELSERIDRLSNIEQLRTATSTAHEALQSDSDDPMSRDASELVEEAVREVERVAEYDPKLAEIGEALRAVSFQLADAARELAAYAGDLDQEGPGELAAANERLAQLNGLFRLYGVDAEAVLAYSEAAATRLGEIDGDDERLEGLEASLVELSGREADLAAKLTKLRVAAATKLSKAVSAELRLLALPDARFAVQVEPLAGVSASGADEVQFLLAPHPGADPRPIAKSASGGELSRVMLALEVVLAGVDPVPTFVFDEVDSGVGGAAAIEIGRRLAMLARTSQVIVVTHLAQVAAFATNHVKVQKDSSGGFTESSCLSLTGDARLGEMARLLSGLADSDSALEHAAELLALGSV